MPEPPGSGFTYRAFISYSHRDKAWGDWLHRSLETWRVPSRLVGKQTEAGTIPRRLHPVFRDREELSSATDLGRKVNEALSQSENLVVICSPASATSRWVNEEVLAYKRMGRGERIFCLIVDGEPNATDLPGREAEECFCPALRFKLDANGELASERTEPIAADARTGKDGKANAKLKLIAGMLGVGFDALKQREQHRKLQRMVAVASVAVVVMAITIVLAVYAFLSRHQAVVAQHQAVVAQHQAQVAQQAAQRRQRQAEDLVNFMLGDLNTKLQQVNRLDIMKSVDDKAMAYFKSLPDADVNNAELVERAKALEKIGIVRMAQGQLPGAQVAFRASTKISSRLATEQPTDAALQVAYARTLSYIGFTYWNQAKLTDAQRNFQAAKNVLQRALSDAPNNLSAEFELALAVNNTGHVLEARGQLYRAAVAYRNFLTLMQKLVMAAPNNSDYANHLGVAYDTLGRMALLRGDLAESVAAYQADDKIQNRLSARNPKNNNQRETVVRVHAILGSILALAGDTETGMHNLQQSVDIAIQLHQFTPKNAGIQDLLGLYLSQLARLQRLHGNLPAAQASTAHSVALLASLTRKDPSNGRWQNDLASALTEQAAESLAANQTEAARAQAQQAVRILDPLLAKHPDERALLLGTMTAKLLLADVSTAPETAQSLREQALTTMQAQKNGKDGPRLLALQVEALLGLGRQSQARARVKQLWRDGYRDPGLLSVLGRAHIRYPVNTAFAQQLTKIMQTKTSQHPASPLPPSMTKDGKQHTASNSKGY